MDNMEEIKEIPAFKEWVRIEPITKGWSTDIKYYIEDKWGSKFVLRLSDIKEMPAKEVEYKQMKNLVGMGIPMSNPLDFGECDNGKKAFQLLTWVEGEDAEIALPQLREEQQYKLGVKAGEILRKIHSIPAPNNQKPWDERFNRKIDITLEKYLKCGVKVNEEENIIKFIEGNRHYINGREQTFQHGDFHVGNMLIHNGDLYIIDFNRSGFGDPWEEYDRINFTWLVSIPFALGQIHSYFNYKVPDEFFKVLALYNARLILSSIHWSIPFGDEDLKIALSNAEEILKSYKNFTTHIPAWYKKNY